jgi:hypothetical protein
MARCKGAFGFQLAGLLAAMFFAGAGCRTCSKAPYFLMDASIAADCDGKPAGDHDISVNDMGGVGVGDNCVVISHEKGHRVRWLPKTSGKNISIIFVLMEKQPIPFDRMACGARDKKGNRLCFLTDCSGECKTTFSNSYTPSQTDRQLNFYYYSPAVSPFLGSAGGGEAGSDPGIRIDP